MSAFDDIDQRFRQPKKREIQLEPAQEGQDCPRPTCRGKLRWHGVTDGAEAGRHLACDDPRCGWTETASG